MFIRISIEVPGKENDPYPASGPYCCGGPLFAVHLELSPSGAGVLHLLVLLLSRGSFSSRKPFAPRGGSYGSFFFRYNKFTCRN
ncbi:hypothetical protein CEXT_179571 [Caerostris extrusa]|uniref:Uncharacterized protein n=1 Tax=Caerostris extrusa TaxID=172846 RepID=A0AAV4P7Z2_CAEEX|nr:hypothetical protein CEXT_179571 [Caerostris extrusa]